MALAMVILVAAFVYSYRSGRREEAQIRTRYQQLRIALSSGDTNAARALFAPEFRGRAHHSLGRLVTFAKPLGRQSSVRFSTAKARVCPERIYHYGLPLGGHTIDMIKVDGQWFFTGKVHID
jgi:hypothetical protein